MIADVVAEALERAGGPEGPFRLDAHPALSEATVEAGDPGFSRYELDDGSAIVVFEGQWAVGVPVCRLEAAQCALHAEDPELPESPPGLARFLPEDQIHYELVPPGPGRSAR